MHPTARPDEVTERLLQFLRGIGLEIIETPLTDACFLPGIEIHEGRLRVDLTRLTWPADLLHEAGHLAVLPPALRASQSGALHECEHVPHAGEAEATAWAYAAACAIGLPAEVLFHAGGYHGRGEGLAMTFSVGVYPGLHGLMQAGMAYGLAEARELGTQPYPHMRHWLRQ